MGIGGLPYWGTHITPRITLQRKVHLEIMVFNPSMSEFQFEKFFPDFSTNLSISALVLSFSMSR